MDTYALKSFLTLSRTLHFARASEECHISPSALSRQIKALELEFGTDLFLRDNRSVQLTSAGERLARFAQDLLGEYDSLIEGFADQSGIVRGDLTLYASVTACYSVLPDLLASFRSEYPEVHLKLQTGDAASAIRRVSQGEIDVAVAARPEKVPPALSFRALTETPLVFVAPTTAAPFDRLLSRPQVPLEAVPLIASETGLGRQKLDGWFRTIKQVPNLYAEVLGNEAILAMVSLGCGIGLVPELVYRSSPLRDRLRVLDNVPDLGTYTVGLCCRQKRLSSPAVRAFWDLAGQGDTE